MKVINVAIVDYDIGNLFSVKKACDVVGIQASITSDPAVIRNSDALILPGVGAFGDAMKNLMKYGLDEEIVAFAKSGKYVMGVCLGMQLLMSSSEEFGFQKGLSIVDGVCRKFPSSNEANGRIRVPQIMWNTIRTKNNSATFEGNHPLSGLKNDEYMYFIHSYYVVPRNDEDVLSYTDYCGVVYSSSICHDNVFAFQFHPEKSGTNGISIYQNFKTIIQQ